MHCISSLLLCIPPPQLVRSGRTVIAAVRSADKAAEVFEAAGLKDGYQQPSGNGSGSGGILITAARVDVTNPATLSARLFESVTQVGVRTVDETSSS